MAGSRPCVGKQESLAEQRREVMQPGLDAPWRSRLHSCARDPQPSSSLCYWLPSHFLTNVQRITARSASWYLEVGPVDGKQSVWFPSPRVTTGPSHVHVWFGSSPIHQYLAL